MIVKSVQKVTNLQFSGREIELIKTPPNFQKASKSLSWTQQIIQLRYGWTPFGFPQGLAQST
jgi:hypothetical protein